MAFSNVASRYKHFSRSTPQESYDKWRKSKKIKAASFKKPLLFLSFYFV